MKYARIVEKVSAHPWAITPEAHRSIRWLLAQKLAGDSEALAADLEKFKVAADRGTDIWGEVNPGMTADGGIARIPIQGILARGVSMIEKSCGVCDYEDVGEEVQEAATDPAISGILLDVDSPGGAINGLYECADLIAEAAKIKPVIAFTAGQMCSAAYYLSAGATAICATPSSDVGSIGCILQMLDDCGALALEGLKMETFRSDPLKATGASGAPLSDQQKAYLQALVDEAATNFKGWVSGHRRGVDGAAMDGRVFSAEVAMSMGLIDQIVGSDTEAASLIN